MEEPIKITFLFFCHKVCVEQRNWKKVGQSDYFLNFLNLEYFYRVVFSESMDNFISNKCG